jgi:hypothetical protein
MLSLEDATTNKMMREVIALAKKFPRTSALSPENRKQLDEGVVMVGGQVALAANVASRRAWLDKRPLDGDAKSAVAWDDTLHEYEDNEFFIRTDTPFTDPSWRVEILSQGTRIVQELAPQLTAVAPLPVQIVLNINSGLDEDPEEGSDATVGVVKFFLLRPDRGMDQRVDIESYFNPAAVFTLPLGEIHPVS